MTKDTKDSLKRKIDVDHYRKGIYKIYVIDTKDKILKVNHEKNIDGKSLPTCKIPVIRNKEVFSISV